MRALNLQTQLLAKALGKTGASSSDMAPLLQGPGEKGTDSFGGARGSAAKEQVRREFANRPDLSLKAAREMLARASWIDPLPPQDAKAYFERFGIFPANSQTRDFGHVVFLLAGIWNHLERGETAAAQGLAGRGLAAMDQVSRGGSASLGLVAPALVAASVAYLRELDAMAERPGTSSPRRPPRGSGADAAGESPPRRPATAKARTKTEPV